MSWLSAHLFARLQAAAFYRGVHSQAVELLPDGKGRSWLDVGTGAGLVAGLAQARGYQATGTDLDSRMLQQAKRRANGMSPAPTFRLVSLEELAEDRQTFDVVSAASLLAVLPDRRIALTQLLSCLTTGGSLLVIEPSSHMTPANAAALQRRSDLGTGAWFLRLWAATRIPQRVVTAEQMVVTGYDTRCHPLLDGLVNAWMLTPGSAAGIPLEPRP